MDKDARELKETATIAIASTIQTQYKLIEDRYHDLKEIYPKIESDKLLSNRTLLLQLSHFAICEKRDLVDQMRDLFLELHDVKSFRKPDVEFLQMIHDAILTTTELIMQQLSYEKEMIFAKGLEESIKSQHVVKHSFLRRKREEPEKEKDTQHDGDDD